MILCKMIPLALITLLLSACSSTPSRPQLFPNEVLKSKSPQASAADIDACLREAEAYAKTPEGEKLKKSANSSSVRSSIGLGLGFGSGGSGIGLGIGMGSGGSRLSGEETVRRNFTNQCLINKGYQIVGWEN
ncbi:MAG: hypothetical protein HOP07_07995 [Bacteriovoracaceae bacterium]|nr:hypothetical protein [Bacteriovoracaceae bacterium]